MADAEHGLEFFKRGVGMFLDVRLEFFGVELAPMSPTRFRRQRPLLGGGQIPVNGTPRHVEPPDGLGFGAARLDEFHHPFPQVQRIGFHARKRIRLCVYVNVNCYSSILCPNSRTRRDKSLTGRNVGGQFAGCPSRCDSGLLNRWKSEREALRTRPSV